MKITGIRQYGTWRDVADLCNWTMNLERRENEPTTEWKHKVLASEHSPIRAIDFLIFMKEIPLYVSTQIIRHHIGIEKWQGTNRTDRTGIDRHLLPQDHPVRLAIKVNLQAVINISKKRKCSMASPKAVELWELILSEIFKIIPELEPYCMPDCMYKGGCTEFKSCGFMPKKIFNTTMVDK